MSQILYVGMGRWGGGILTSLPCTPLPHGSGFMRASKPRRQDRESLQNGSHNLCLINLRMTSHPFCRFLFVNASCLVPSAFKGRRLYKGKNTGKLPTTPCVNFLETLDQRFSNVNQPPLVRQLQLVTQSNVGQRRKLTQVFITLKSLLKYFKVDYRQYNKCCHPLYLAQTIFLPDLIENHFISQYKFPMITDLFVKCFSFRGLGQDLSLSGGKAGQVKVQE